MKIFTLAIIGVLLAAIVGSLSAQFSGDEISARSRWEDFLRTARIESEEQLGGPDAVTKPWKLRLEKNGTTRFGLWKDIEEGEAGVRDFWQFEIAAYRLDGLLGLEMISPTVERRFLGRKGSLQLWVENVESLKLKTQKGTSPPPQLQGAWNRAAYIERAFDSLIANEDRNANNTLVTPDWRMILIDHSRSFRTAGNFVQHLIFGDGGLLRTADGGPYSIWPLPRVFVDKIKALDAASVRKAVRPYLSSGEVEAILTRKKLLLAELAAAGEKWGEDKVIY